MKKFTIKKLDSRLVMLLLSILFVGAFSASAEEYKPMIRYDRVWECLNLEGPYKQMYIKCIKFDGSEKINGKLYHRLVTFKKSTLTENGYQIQDDVLEHEGYLREENGKVYTLVVGCSGLYNPSIYIDELNPEDITEILIYDFSRKNGEIYEAWTFITEEAYQSEYTVISENVVEIDGEKCRSFEIAGIDRYHSKQKDSHIIIEGIGAGEYGCLNYHEYDTQPTMMWCRNRINRVFDMDGNTIFRSLDGCLYEDLQYAPFSSTDRVIDISEQPETDAPIFDILGRRIVPPAPGQLYIKDGIKHIAK